LKQTNRQTDGRTDAEDINESVSYLPSANLKTFCHRTELHRRVGQTNDTLSTASM